MHQIIPVGRVRVTNGLSSRGSAAECLTPHSGALHDSSSDQDQNTSEQVARFDVLLKVNVEVILKNGRPTIRSFRSLTLDDVLGGLLPLTGLGGCDEGFLPLTKFVPLVPVPA